MRMSSVQPSLLSYKLALSSLVHAGQWPLALHLHSRLTEEGCVHHHIIVLQRHPVLCCTYCAVLCHSLLNCAVLYCAVLYGVVLLFH